MNILILTADYYAQLGGKFTHILMLKSGLEELGHSVDILFPKRTPLNALVISGGGRILDFFGIGIYYRQNAIKAMLRFSLGNFLCRKRIDIINAEDVIAFFAINRSKIKVPVILTIHGELAQEMESAGHIKSAFEKKLFLNMEKRSYELADYTVTVDTRLKNHIQDLAPLAKSKLQIIQNFIDVESFRNRIDLLNMEEIKKKTGISSDKKVILVPRRLVLKCGVIYAIKAAELIRNKFNRCDLVFLIVGVGPERSNILNYINDNKLQELVSLIDGAEYDKMPEFYKIAEVVLIPSINVKGYIEATSLSAIEAMAANIPVIASDIGGLAEMISNGVTGILVPEKSSEDIAKNIIKILDNEDLRNVITSAAFDYVSKNHSNRVAAQKFARIYTNEIKNNG
ncbi:MAG: glycosyltransferase family 4 protein [Candidatus Omnitrophica bacterium]|nr:glycosyltransferase family 4 protein [Candidatus Omnitrophota bacterium]MDD5546258.1 glycosyltransferase family 4 protein [Candidatus Omnitrophota bacterium]